MLRGNPKLLDLLRQALRLRHYSPRTERAYCGWVGQDIRTIQKLLIHRDLSTTMLHTHVFNRGPLGVTSPLDRLNKR